jgi:hypothetical protein
MAAKKKHPRNMTNREAAEHLFHPKLLKHVREALNVPKKRVTKKV